MNTTLKVKLVKEQVELDVSSEGVHTFGAFVDCLRPQYSAANCFLACGAEYALLKPDVQVRSLLSQRSLVRVSVSNDTRRYSTR